MISGRGQGWNWVAVSFELPLSMKDKIRVVPFQRFGRANGTILWNSLRMVNYLSSQLMILPILLKIKISNFRGNGYGDWICCRRLYTSFGYVYTTVYL